MKQIFIVNKKNLKSQVKKAPHGPPRHSSNAKRVNALRNSPSLHEIGQKMKNKGRYIESYEKQGARKVKPTGPFYYPSAESQVRASQGQARLSRLNRIKGESLAQWSKRTTNIKFLKEVFPKAPISHLKQISRTRKNRIKQATEKDYII